MSFPRNPHIYHHWTCCQFKTADPHAGEYTASGGWRKVPGAVTQRQKGRTEEGGRTSSGARHFRLPSASVTPLVRSPHTRFQPTSLALITHSPLTSIDLLSRTLNRQESPGNGSQRGSSQVVKSMAPVTSAGLVCNQKFPGICFKVTKLSGKNTAPAYGHIGSSIC